MIIMIIVTIYNKKGEAFVTEGVYCRHCLNTSGSESDQSLTEPPIQVTKHPKQKPEEEEHEEVGKAATESNAVIPTSPTTLMDGTLTEPLILEDNHVSTDRLDVRDKEKISASSIIGALTWLNWKLTIKDWKRFIVPAIALVLWSICIIFVSTWSYDVSYCPDGR